MAIRLRSHMTYHTRLRLNIIFAIAMAWLEAAVVIYLRTLVDRIDPYQPDPLPLVGHLGSIELVREAATLIMLLCVGWLCGRTLLSRLAFTATAFGVWDISYYAFLRVMGPWPTSLLDWDILFLIPLPWWGPVLAPVLIAFLLILAGVLVSCLEEGGVAIGVHPGSLLAGLAGVLLALIVFMSDAVQAAPGGLEAIQRTLPITFPWSLFLLALGLMCVPLLGIALRRKKGKVLGENRKRSS